MADTKDTKEETGAGVKPPKPDQGDIAGQPNSPTPEEQVANSGRSKAELERDAGQPVGSDADVTRTAGEGAEATIDANVGRGEPNPVGIPDAALGQHAEGENQALLPSGGKALRDKQAAQK